MKGSPMKRNFSVGASSPAKQLLEPNNEKTNPIDPTSWSGSGNVEETNKPLLKHSVDDEGNPTMLTFNREYDPRTKTWKKVPVYQRY